MKLINLTPHPVVLRTESGDVTVPLSGTVARVTSTPGVPMDMGLGVPVFSAPVWGEVEGLPAPEEGKVFIVSALVAARCGDRHDVVSPGTGPNDEAVRNEKGHIQAVTRLIAS